MTDFDVSGNACGRRWVIRADDRDESLRFWLRQPDRRVRDGAGGGLVRPILPGTGAEDGSRRYGVRWLVFGASALAVVGVWLTHFIAVLGFDVPSSPIRYNVPQTFSSLFISILVTVVAFQVVGTSGRPSCGSVRRSADRWRCLRNALLRRRGEPRRGLLHVRPATGRGIAADRRGRFDSRAGVDGLDRSYPAVGAAAVVFATMVAATHYTGMAALQVHLTTNGRTPAGVEAVSIVIPVTIGGILTLLAMLFAALGMMSDDGMPSRWTGRSRADIVPPIRRRRPIRHTPQQPRDPLQTRSDAPTQIVTVTRCAAMISLVRRGRYRRRHARADRLIARVRDLCIADPRSRCRPHVRIVRPGHRRPVQRYRVLAVHHDTIDTTDWLEQIGPTLAITVTSSAPTWSSSRV